MRSRTLAEFFPSLAVAAVSLLGLVPLLRSGFPATSDGMFHLLRIVEFGRIWSLTNLFPRWAPDFYLGYGYPVFVFTPYLPYALGVSLELFRLTPVQAMGAEEAMGMVASAILSYAWLRSHFDSWSSAIGAALYTLAPYHLVNLYFRGDLAEFLAQALLPALLFAAERLAQKVSLGRGLVVALVGALLLSTHLLSALLIAPVLLLDAGLEVCDRHVSAAIKRIAALTGAAVAAALLAATCWLPGVASAPAATLGKLLHFYNYRANFVTPAQLLAHGLLQTYAPVFSFGDQPGYQFGIVQSAALVLAVPTVLFALRQARSRATARLLVFLVVGFGSLLACTAVSAPMWMFFKPLQLAQFPWRWLSIAALAASFCGAATCSALKPRWRAVVAPAMLAVTVISSLALLHPLRFHVPANINSAAGIAQFEMTYNLTGTSAAGEYLPPSVTHRARVSAWSLEQAIGWKPPADPIADVQLSLAPSTHPKFTLDEPSTAVVTLPVLAAPGWVVRDASRRLPVSSAPQSGLVQVRLPAGAHTLQLTYDGTNVVRLADAITVLTLVAFLIAACWFLRAALRLPGGEAIRHIGGDVWLVTLSVVVLLTAATSLAVVALRASVERTGSLAPLDASIGSIEFQGYAWSTPGVSAGLPAVQAGHTFAMTFLLHSSGNGQLLAQLLDPSGTVWATWSVPVIAGPHHVHVAASLPSHLPAGLYTVRLSATDSSSTVIPWKLSRASFVDLLPVNGSLELGPLAVLPSTTRASTTPHAGWHGAARPLDAAVPQSVRAGAMLTLSWQWNVSEHWKRQNLTEVVHLVDTAGRTVVARDALPAGGYFPSPFWSSGSSVREVLSLRVPPTLLPGDYQVHLGLDGPGGPLPAVSPQGAAIGDELTLGEVRVLPPAVSAALTAPAMAVGGLNVAVGSLPTAADPGSRVGVALLIQSPQAAPPIARVAVTIAQRGVKLAATDQPLGGATFPAKAWRAGETEQQWFDVQLPPGAPPGLAQVGVTVVHTDGTLASAVVGTLKITSRPHVFAAHPALILGDRFSDGMTLVGLTLRADGVPSKLSNLHVQRKLDVTAFWRVPGATSDLLKVSVQILNSQGALIAQSDSAVGENNAPSAGWVANEILESSHRIDVSSLAPGNYQLILILYNGRTGQRYTVSREPTLTLGTVTVGSKSAH
ncbi:MAG: 6-pyruvoyl-tetrahydropterin synthase-related protein [Chloroflexi bacterium]|nr:6-pyruvoyl-tetrahydropterin synthase-related protein [Chloroflexota bacterium]